MKLIINKTSFLLLFSSLLMIGCKDPDKVTKERPIKVTTSAVKNYNSNYLFGTSGTIEAIKSANISTRLMGDISKIFVNIGDKVKKGNLLLSINSADLKAKRAQTNAQIIRANSAFINANKDFKRYTQLFKENSASQKELDNITTKYEQAKAGLEAAKQMLNEVNANLAYANIRAPFNGIITGKFINNGDLANPGIPLLSIENTSGYLVKTYVNENQINKIHKGGAVYLKVKSNNKTLKGIISEISISSKNSGSLYLVKIDINPAKNIYSGMFVSVNFIGTPDINSTIAIPKSVLIHKGQLSGVYTISMQNTAILRWLRLGKSYGNKIEVLSGLNKNEKIITNAQGKLYNGVNVTIK